MSSRHNKVVPGLLWNFAALTDSGSSCFAMACWVPGVRELGFGRHCCRWLSCQALCRRASSRVVRHGDMLVVVGHSAWQCALEAGGSTGAPPPPGGLSLQLPPCSGLAFVLHVIAWLCTAGHMLLCA
jgi:hypothetical protein